MDLIQRISRSWPWVLAALVLTLGSALLLLFLTQPHQPAYRGIRLSEWLDGTMAKTEAHEVHEILESVGPEALPWLVNTFERDSHRTLRSRLFLWYSDFYRRHWKSPVRPFLPPIQNAPWEVIRFNSMPLLARLAPGTRYEDRVLGDIILEAPDQSDRVFAQIRLRCLGRFTNSPAKVVPVLLAGITNPATIDTSIEALRPFREYARRSLYRLAIAESGYVRPAELALEKIDSNSFRELRINKSLRND